MGSETIGEQYRGPLTAGETVDMANAEAIQAVARAIGGLGAAQDASTSVGRELEEGLARVATALEGIADAINGHG